MRRARLVLIGTVLCLMVWCQKALCTTINCPNGLVRVVNAHTHYCAGLACTPGDEPACCETPCWTLNQNYAVASIDNAIDSAATAASRAYFKRKTGSPRGQWRAFGSRAKTLQNVNVHV